MDDQSIALLNSLYQQKPETFTDDQVASLQQVNKDAGKDFQPKASAQPFNLLNTVAQLGEGFLQGFTTIKMGEAPQNTVEGIARSVGSLLGFVGFVPGPGIFKAFKREGMAGVTAAATHDALGIQLKSVPMWISDKIMGGLQKTIAQTEAASAIKFFKNGSIARDVTEGALSLGIASAVGAAQPWELNIEDRMKAFLGGAEAGGVFRGIGNTFAKGGAMNMGSEATNLLARTLSASLYSGIPSTLRGEPMEMQVYEYLLGAWFGKNEQPAYMREVHGLFKDYLGDTTRQMELLDPSKLPGYDNLSDNAKIEAKAQAQLLVGGWEESAKASEAAIAASQAFAGSMTDALATGRISPEQYRDWSRVQVVEGAYRKTKDTVDQEHPELDEETRSAMARQGALANVAEFSRQARTNTDALKRLWAASDQENVWMHSNGGTQVLKMFDDREVARQWIAPVYELANQLAESRGAIDKKNDVTYASEIIDHVKASGKGANQLDAFRARILKEYSLDTTKDADLNRKIVQTVALVSQSKRLNRLILNKDGDVVQMPRMDMDGDSTSMDYVPTFIEKKSGATAHLLSSQFTEDEEKPLNDIEFNAAKMIVSAYGYTASTTGRDGTDVARSVPLIYFGHVKDTPHEVFLTSVVSRAKDGWTYEVNGEKRTVKFLQKLDELNRAPAMAGRDARSDYQANREDFIREYAEGKPISEQKKVELRDIYEHLTMQNIAVAEQMNDGISIGDQMASAHEAQGGLSFMTKVTDFNKRMQPMFNRDPLADPEQFKDILPDGKMKGVLVQMDESPQGGNAMQKVEDKKGNVVDKIYGEATDGVFLMTGPVYERLAASMGLPKDTGGQKGTVMYSDKADGMFIGKLFFHRASPEMEKSMTERGIHFQAYTTAAKQFGKRPVFTEKYSGGRFSYERQGGTFLDDGTFELPVDSIRMNFGAGEMGGFHDTYYKRQLADNLDLVHSIGWDENILKPANRGRDSQNLIAAKYWNVNEKRRAELDQEFAADVEKHGVQLGSQRLVDLMVGAERKSSPIYNTVLKDVLKWYGREMETAENRSDDALAELTFLSKAKTAADRIKAANISDPLVMELKQIKPFFHTMLRRYLTDRLMGPTSEGSWKSKLYSADRSLISRIHEGEYLAADGLKDKPIQFLGKETRLEDAWTKYNSKTLSGNDQAQAERDLEHFVMRVPADSPSGVRVMKFKGFSGSQGYGIYLHPKDMQALGGADLDGDAADVYTKIGSSADFNEKLKTYFRSKKDMWQKENGVTVPSSSDGLAVEGRDPLITARLKSPASMVDPLSRAKVGRWANMGNSMLGRALTRTMRLREMQKFALDNGGTIRGKFSNSDAVRLMLAKKLPGADRFIPEELEGLKASLDKTRRRQSDWDNINTAVKKAGLSAGVWKADLNLGQTATGATKLQEMRRNVINTAADAAKGDELYAYKDIRSAINSSAFSNMKVQFKRDGKLTVSAVDDYLLVDNHDYYKKLTAIGGFATARDPKTGRAFSFFEALEGLQANAKVDKKTGEIPFDPSAVRFRVANHLAQIELTARDIDLTHVIGPGWPLARKALDKMIRENREFREMVNRKQITIDTRGEAAFAQTVDKTTLGGQDDINEIRMQDLQDVATWSEVGNLGQQVMDSQVKGGAKREDVLAYFAQIADKIDDLKAEDATIRKDKFSGEEPKARKTVEQVVKEASDFRKALPEVYAPYFDAWAAGSLFRQGEEFEARPGVKALRAGEAEANRQGGETLGAWKQALHEESKDWNRTNSTNFAYALDVVAPDAIRNQVQRMVDIGRTVSNILPRAKSEFAETELRSVVFAPKLVTPELKAVMPETVLMLAPIEQTKVIAAVLGNIEQVKVSNTFAHDAFELAKLQVKDPELKQLSGDLRRLLDHFPQFMRDIQGWLEGTVAESNDQGVGVGPRKFTKQHLKMVVNSFKVGDKFWWELSAKEREFSLANRHFLYDPEMLGRKMLAGDHKLMDSVSPVIDDVEGPIFKPVKVFKSHMSEIADLWQHAHWSFNGAMKNEGQVLDRFLFPVRASGKDGYTLFSIASDIRQGGVGRRPGVSAESAAAYATIEKRGLDRFNKEYDFGRKRVRYSDMTGSTDITAKEALEKITKLQTDFFARWQSIISNPINEKRYLKYHAGTQLIDVTESLRALNDHIKYGRQLPDIGIEGMYKLIHQMSVNKMVVNGQRLGDLSAVDRERTMAELFNRTRANGSRPYAFLRYKNLEFMSPAMYFPHNGHSEKMLRERLNNEREKMRAAVSGPEAVAMDNLESLERVTSLNLEDAGMSDSVMRQLEARTLSDKDYASLNIRPQALKLRDELPLPGWDQSPLALERYQQQMLRGYYNMVGAVMSSARVDNFAYSKPFGENTKPWEIFMRIFNRNNLGHPSTFPQEWLDHPEYKIKGNPGYYWLTDQYWLDKAAQIDKEHFQIISKPTDEMTAKDKEHNWEVKKNQQQRIRKIAAFSNLEAKWEMISMLSHTKTAINNLMGGTTNNAVSLGLGPYVRSHSLNYWRGIFPQIRSMDDMRLFAEKHGAGESWVNDALESRGLGQDRKFSGALAEAVAEIKRNPKLSDIDLFHIADKHGVDRAFFDTGAWFMRKTERYLRNQSFLAHYSKAREALGANSFTFEDDDPWLIKMANRGVKTTQFLYNNASRPAFGRTSLGKVFTRFQMWAWNSGKMRLEVYNKAKEVGYAQGSPEFERLRRLMISDLFTFALAGLFPSTIFGSNMAPPWSFLQDASSFFFGNDEDKDRAFFGSLPYPLNIVQPVSPPITRLLYPTFQAAVSGNWDRFFDYHVWTWFPYGRMANSVRKTMQDPSMAVEQFTGLPLHRLASDVKRKDQDRATTEGIISGLL